MKDWLSLVDKAVAIHDKDMDDSLDIIYDVLWELIRIKEWNIINNILNKTYPLHINISILISVRNYQELLENFVSFYEKCLKETSNNEERTCIQDFRDPAPDWVCDWFDQIISQKKQDK